MSGLPWECERCGWTCPPDPAITAEEAECDSCGGGMVAVTMRREQKVALANANVSRRREREALEQGDLEGARIQAQIAADYEEDADFWAMVKDSEVAGGGNGD